MADKDVKSKINAKAEISKKRDELAARLAKLEPGTEEFKNTKDAIADLEKILHERTTVWQNGLKVCGLVVVSVLGLALAHHDDIGDSIPGKAVSKFFDSIFKRM